MSWSSELSTDLRKLVIPLLILVLGLIMHLKCHVEPDDTRFYGEPGDRPMSPDFLSFVAPWYDYKTDAKLKVLRVKFPTENGTVNKSFEGEAMFPIVDLLKNNMTLEWSRGKRSGRTLDLKFYDEYGGAQRLEIRELESGQAYIIWRPDSHVSGQTSFAELLEVLGL